MSFYIILSEVAIYLFIIKLANLTCVAMRLFGGGGEL